MSSNTCRLLWLVLASFVLLNAPESEAQTVVLIKGSGVRPATVTKGAALATPVVVQVPAGAIVVLEERWQSDQQAYDCQSWVVISGTSYQVKSQKTVGSCPVSVRGDELARAGRGETFVARAVFYGDPKYDAPTTPEGVRQSDVASGPLQRDFNELSKQSAGPSVVVPPPAPLAVRNMSALMENQGFMGGTDFREVQVGSAVECSSLCASENACVAMTYIVSAKKCYLKNALTQLVAAGGMVSAVKK